MQPTLVDASGAPVITLPHIQPQYGLPLMPPMAGYSPYQTQPGYSIPNMVSTTSSPAVKEAFSEDRPSGSSHSANTSSGVGAGGMGFDDSPQAGDRSNCMGTAGMNKSRYRGVSYDRKKAKWRVQIKVAALGKSGVSVGYFDTEEAAARAYDRAAIGLLGHVNPNLQTNFPLLDYEGESIPPLTGKTREEVKTTLKSERIKQAPRRRFTSRQRTSRFMGVGSSNRKNQWQARILVHGKVTHLGYYETEEEAARVYDRVSIALHGSSAQTNFPHTDYSPDELAVFRGLDRENLQRALGVKPMDKSSRYRGVSRKKGKWEAKVMVNRRWAYRELFDSEEEAARAYDRALWRLKPREARSYVNFKDDIPPDVADLVAAVGDDDRDLEGPLDNNNYEDSEGEDEYSEDDLDDLAADIGYRREYKTSAAERRSGRTSMRRRNSSSDLQTTGEADRAAFVPRPDGGMQLHLPGGSLKVPGMIPNPGSDQHLAGLNGGGGGGGADNNLLIRVGSESHLIPGHQQTIRKQSPPASGGTLGKRSLQRIRSEPYIPVAAAPIDSPLFVGNNNDVLNELMHDTNDLFRLDEHDMLKLDMAELNAIDAETSSVLDFINNNKSTPDVDGLPDLDDELLAALEFTRPKKMSKSMSMSDLAGVGMAPPKPPLAPKGVGSSSSSSEDANGHASHDKVGPLGQPIKRTNTFTASLQSLDEGTVMHHLVPHHSLEDDMIDLVGQLMNS